MRIKVEGYIDITDEEYDPGPRGPLTEAAFLDYTSEFASLDDITFTVEED